MTDANWYTTNKMNPEYKSKWVSALKSGKYKQGRFALRSLDHKYCCLGVLLDIAGTEWILENNDDGYYVPEWASTGYLSLEHRDKFNISGETMDTLTKLNDQDRASFEEIAYWIEENL